MRSEMGQTKPSVCLYQEREDSKGNSVVCEPCGVGSDSYASPKHPVFREPYGQPPPVFDSTLVLDMPRHL